MKLSVLIPVYNVEDYLEECVDSVLKQSNQNFEIVLVNDGSTDTSGEICNRLKGANPEKIKLIHKENEGLLLARWDAIQAASGEVLVFLDSDDCLRTDALEILANCFDETCCDMVLYDSSDRKDFSNKIQFFPFQHRFCMVGMEKSVLYQRVAERKIPNSVCMKAAKRHCYAELPNLNDFRNVKSGEDLLLSLYAITAAQKIIYINETLYFYRQREGSIVHSFNPSMMQSIKTVNMELERFVKIWEMPDLYPLIYAREARTWIGILIILLEKKDQMNPAQFHQQLQNLATDPYFLRAYASMDILQLSLKYRLLVKWLYHKRYVLLYVVALAKKIKRKVTLS